MTTPMPRPCIHCWKMLLSPCILSAMQKAFAPGMDCHGQAFAQKASRPCTAATACQRLYPAVLSAGGAQAQHAARQQLGGLPCPCRLAGDLPARFGTVKVDELTISGVENNTMVCGEPVSVQLRMHLGEMKPQEILVQLVIERALINGSFRDKPEILRLGQRAGENGQDGMRYTASYIPSFSGHYRYGVRIMPVHPAQACRWKRIIFSGPERFTALCGMKA